MLAVLVRAWVCGTTYKSAYSHSMCRIAVMFYDIRRKKNVRWLIAGAYFASMETSHPAAEGERGLVVINTSLEAKGVVEERWLAAAGS